MIDWQKIKTVFLDMDGTLLDLHFDNHFWGEHLPKRYAEIHNIALEQATHEVSQHSKKTRGTLDWYCIETWGTTFDLDIPSLTREVVHLIELRPHVIEFLGALKQSDKRIVLLTNAHPHGLEIKLEHTLLDDHLDNIISTHQFKLPKESPELWQQLQTVEPYNPEETLFIDDSLPILRMAKQQGIKHLLAIKKPDSKLPENDVEEFLGLSSFADLLPIK